MEVLLLDTLYKVVEEEKEGFIKEEVESKFTEYFLDYDYVFGDWAYGKLRLKGFNKKGHHNFKEQNDIASLNTYKKDFCAPECKNFMLEKIS